MYYVGAINRVGIEPLGENDFYGQSYFVDPEGKFVGDVGDAYKPELIVRDLDLDKIQRGPRSAGRSTATAAPTPTTRSGRRADAMATTLIKNGKVISTTGVIAQDVLIDGETIAAARRSPGYFAAAEQGADRVIDAAGKYVIPGGIDVHTHMELPFGGTFAQRHVRDRIARRGVGRRHDDRRHGGAALPARTSTTASPNGTARPTATAPSTTPSTRSSAASTTSR